jgi:nucleotide-binding universal stress UspA family protein
MQTANRAKPSVERTSLYKRIVVPINGYPPNERAIPVADALAAQFGSDVELSSMVFHENYHTERSHLLHRLAVRVHTGAITTVDAGSDPAAYVLDLINRPDALVVLSGGTTVLGIPGSMTVDVLRFASRPFVIVGPKTDSFWAGPIEHILVLLDGSAVAEASLAVAIRWASQLNARIELLQVIDPKDVLEASILAPDASEIGYLESVRDSLQTDARLPIEYEIVHAPAHDRARAITRYLDRAPRSIICMASNGSHHSSSMVGRTTLQVIHDASVPVLLTRS